VEKLAREMSGGTSGEREGGKGGGGEGERDPLFSSAGDVNMC